MFLSSPVNKDSSHRPVFRVTPGVPWCAMENSRELCLGAMAVL